MVLGPAAVADVGSGASRHREPDRKFSWAAGLGPQIGPGLLLKQRCWSVAGCFAPWPYGQAGSGAGRMTVAAADPCTPWRWPDERGDEAGPEADGRGVTRTGTGLTYGSPGTTWELDWAGEWQLT